MALKEQVLRVLKSTETQRINFNFIGDDETTDITIDYLSFQKVIAAIESGKIVFSDPSIVPAGVDGRYESDGNRFAISASIPKFSRLFDALIVHESVHAYFDIIGKRLLGIDSEAAGYIAQGYYFRNSGFTREIKEPLMSLGRKCVNLKEKGHINPRALTELRTELEGRDEYRNIIFIDSSKGEDKRFDRSNYQYFQGNGI